MSLELRPEVREFAEAMELTLRENDHKGVKGWDRCSYSYLHRSLEQEVKEATDVMEAASTLKRLRTMPPTLEKRLNIEVCKELIDCANFIMMMWDGKRVVKKKGAPHDSDTP